MSAASTPIPIDHPLFLAWVDYKASEDFENSAKWALDPQHTEGSMWAAFMNGWQARDGVVPNREKLGRLIYECQHKRNGGRWDLVETKDVWYDFADALMALAVERPSTPKP